MKAVFKWVSNLDSFGSFFLLFHLMWAAFARRLSALSFPLPPSLSHSFHHIYAVFLISTASLVPFLLPLALANVFFSFSVSSQLHPNAQRNQIRCILCVNSTFLPSSYRVTTGNGDWLINLNKYGILVNMLVQSRFLKYSPWLHGRRLQMPAELRKNCAKKAGYHAEIGSCYIVKCHHSHIVRMWKTSLQWAFSCVYISDVNYTKAEEKIMLLCRQGFLTKLSYL